MSVVLEDCLVGAPEYWRPCGLGVIAVFSVQFGLEEEFYCTVGDVLLRRPGFFYVLGYASME